MHAVLYWVGAILAVLTFLLLYVQFEIGEDERAIRDRLADWYVAIADGKWDGLLGYAVAGTEDFLSHVFGTRLLSWRFFLTAGALGAIVNALVMRELAVAFHYRRLDNMILFGLMNLVVDVSALLLTRFFLRKSVGASHRKPMLEVFVVFVIAYFAYNVSFAAAALVVHFTAPDIVDLFSTFLFIFVAAIMPLELAFDHGKSLWMFSVFLPATFSSALLFGVFVGAGVVYLSRPLTQRPLAHVIERFAGAKHGVLTAAIGGLSALATLLAVFRER